MLDFEPGALRSAVIRGAAETANASRRSKVSLVGVSDQCREFEGRGLHSNGAAYRALVEEAYEGVRADEATLGIPSGILEQQIPDRGI
jgi:hypothetical protein